MGGFLSPSDASGMDLVFTDNYGHKSAVSSKHPRGEHPLGGDNSRNTSHHGSLREWPCVVNSKEKVICQPN